MRRLSFIRHWVIMPLMFIYLAGWTDVPVFPWVFIAILFVLPIVLLVLAPGLLALRGVKRYRESNSNIKSSKKYKREYRIRIFIAWLLLGVPISYWLFPVQIKTTRNLLTYNGQYYEFEGMKLSQLFYPGRESVISTEFVTSTNRTITLDQIALGMDKGSSSFEKQFNSCTTSSQSRTSYRKVCRPYEFATFKHAYIESDRVVWLKTDQNILRVTFDYNNKLDMFDTATFKVLEPTLNQLKPRSSVTALDNIWP